MYSDCTPDNNASQSKRYDEEQYTAPLIRATSTLVELVTYMLMPEQTMIMCTYSKWYSVLEQWNEEVASANEEGT